MSVGGLLSGAIGGLAEGVGNVAQQSAKSGMAERAAMRKEEAATRLQTQKDNAADKRADKKASDAKANAKTDKPRIINVKKTDPETLEETSETLQYNKDTDSYTPFVDDREVNKYNPYLKKMRDAGVPQAELSKVFKTRTGVDLNPEIVKRFGKTYTPSR